MSCLCKEFYEPTCFLVIIFLQGVLIMLREIFIFFGNSYCILSLRCAYSCSNLLLILVFIYMKTVSECSTQSLQAEKEESTYE